MEWKWSIQGEIAEKSPRPYKISQTELQSSYNSIKTENDALQQSMLSENDNWNIGICQDFDLENIKTLNKREDTYNKMAVREMISQHGKNPFSPNNNYLDDIITQDQFLKPVSTTTEDFHKTANNT
jgi:hypothetical protein